MHRMEPPFGSRSTAASSGKGTETAGQAAPSVTQRILALVARIPSGRVMTYGDIADSLGLGSAPAGRSGPGEHRSGHTLAPGGAL